MKCKACGTETPVESVFCSKCGERLQDEIDVPEPSPPVKSSSPAERLRASGRPNDPQDDEEEEQLWEGGYSGKAMIGGWLFAAVATLLLLVGVVAWMRGSGTAWLILLILLVLLWGGLALGLAYQKLGVHYELTNQRFIHRTGILRRISDRIEVIDIDDVTYEQGLVQRMVGVGTIKISSSDRTHPELVLRGIDEVGRIADLIDDVRRQERRRRGLHIEAI